MSKEPVLRRIQDIGMVPSVRALSAEDAIFAAESVICGGIALVEITLTVPDAYKVIAHVANSAPDVIVGAGGVLNKAMARCCVDAGARFLTTDGMELDVVRFAAGRDLVAIPGALTPTEVLAAWRLEPDVVKIVPCGQVGGDRYIRALKAMFPNIPMMAAGGATQANIGKFLLAGALAVGVGAELIPADAVWMRQQDRIAELARRFTGQVAIARTSQH